MVTQAPRDRLQPALLDRLIDKKRLVPIDTDTERVMDKEQLRKAVLRDLQWLLNATRPLSPDAARQHPHAAQSVLNFGLPALAGQLASRVDVPALKQKIRQAIQHFEPRILPGTLSVEPIESLPVMEMHNVIDFEIRGHLWAQPVPLELLLRTRLDLEAGQVKVIDPRADRGDHGADDAGERA